MKLADARFNKRLCARLTANSEALQAVEARLGLDRRMVERFHLGLSEPYPKSAASTLAVTHQDVLVAPICDSDGRFYAPYGYQALPTITIDNRIDPPESWSAGDSESYFSRKREPDDVVIVCEDVRDLWALTALIRGTVLETTHVVLAPTQRGKWPNAWRTPEFWKSWKRIIVAVGTGQASGTGEGVERDEKARALARMMNRDVHRVLPYKASSWLAARLDGIRYDTFHKQLRDAALLKAGDLKLDEAKRYSSATGEDVSCAYVRGYLFEALPVLEVDETDGQRTQRRLTIVVRSDRTKHVAEEMPSPPGTPKADRVYRLMPDGALLSRLPTASSDSTWRWKSASAFIYEGANSPPLVMLLEQIEAHLRCSV